MSLKSKSAADIQAIIDAALNKKPALPKGLAEEIAFKEAAVAARKAAKVEAAASDAAVEEKKAKSIAKTKAKAVAGKNSAKVSKKDEKKNKKSGAAAVKGSRKASLLDGKKVKKVNKKDLALKKFYEKEAKKDKKAAQFDKRKEEREAAKAAMNEEFDSDIDGSLLEEDEEEEMDDETKQQRFVDSALARAISGGADKKALAEDPLAATFGGFMYSMASREEDQTDNAVNGNNATNAPAAAAASSGSLLQNLAKEKGSEYVDREALLSTANTFFSKLGEVERKRHSLARRKIEEMKAINRRGGDKDGFKYVLPTNVKSYARMLAGDEDVNPEDLRSHFLGDGVKETESAPSRKKEKKRFHDDFYQFQVAKKWTKNAENFLRKAKNTKNMFISRQQRLRSTKKM